MTRLWTAILVTACLGAATAPIDAAGAQATSQARSQGASAQTPAPGEETALRRVIGELQQGQPDYGRMGDALAAATRQQLPAIAPAMKALGAEQSVAFKAAGPGGVDVYDVKFAGGNTEWRIGLGTDGKITTLFFRPAP